LSIKINIQTPKTKEATTLAVNPTDTIRTVKEEYFRKVGTRVNNQWIYDASVLKDERTISSYEIEDKDIIEAHPLSKGG